jgi:processing peptidase subunit beta
MAMASRRLALSMQQGLRAKQAIRAIKPNANMGLTRSLATPVSHGSTTESTTLSNGFTVRRD